MDKSSNMLKNTMIVFVFALGAKLLSLVRESVIAAYAGTSLEADAYYMVMSIYTIFELGLSTSIYQSFFPIYKEVSLSEAENKRYIFANSVIVILSFFSVLLVLIEILGSNIIVGIMAPGFSSEGRSLAQQLLILSAPMLIVVTIAECFSTILRSHNVFTWSQARELGTHIVAIFSIFLLYKALGIYAMGIGLLIGAIARLLIQVPAISHVHSFKAGIQLKSTEIKKMLTRIPAVLVTASVTEIKNIVDKIMASTLATGTVATLNYGYRLESAISGLIFNSIATGIFPNMVQLYVENKRKELSKLIERCIQIILIIVIPLEIASIFFGIDLVSVVYQRGVFGETEVRITAMVFIAYMLGAAFFGISLILSNTFYSAGDTRTPMIINCIDLGSNIIFNFLFVKIMGVTGLAIATSLAGFISFIIRTIAIKRYVKLNIKCLLIEFVKILSAGLISNVIAYIILHLFNVNYPAFRLILAAIIMGALYLGFVFIFRAEGILTVLHWIRIKIKK